MLQKPDIRELKAALALVGGGGFAGAAAELCISQPAVSARIAKLEQIFGFPLFHRRTEGTELTAEGQALLPFLSDFNLEFTQLINKISYCKRATVKEVRIQLDASRLSQTLGSSRICTDHRFASATWRKIEVTENWRNALLSYESDILLAGSFLGDGECDRIRTLPILRQPGLTCAWNPEFHSFSEASFNFPAAMSSTTIFPAESLARGFKKFVDSWCESTYGFQPAETICAHSETDAIETCRHGMGVLVLPGDAEERLNLRSHGLMVAHSFRTLLPEAFIYGIRYRADERNPLVLEVVKQLLGEFCTPQKTSL